MKKIFAVIILIILPYIAMAAPEMVRIQGGTFMMGSPENEGDRNENEFQHQMWGSQTSFIN